MQQVASRNGFDFIGHFTKVSKLKKWQTSHDKTRVGLSLLLWKYWNLSNNKKACCFAATLLDSRVSIHVNTVSSELWNHCVNSETYLRPIFKKAVFSLTILDLVQWSTLNFCVNSESYLSSLSPIYPIELSFSMQLVVVLQLSF